MLKRDKANENIHRKPLNNSNYCTPDTHKASPKLHHDPLLTTLQEELNGPGDLIHLLLSDPLLKELNLSLQKEAQQQKKAKLLENFPLRYKNLVHTQMLFKQVQSQLKEHQQQSQAIIAQLQKEKQVLQDQVAFFKRELDNKDEQLLQMKEQHRCELIYIEDQRCGQMEKAQKQKQQQIAELETKMNKCRNEKDHLIEFLEELKEEAENLKQENQRIVLLLTHKDLEINQLQAIAKEHEVQYQTTKENFMAQIVQLELQCSQKTQAASQTHQQLSLVVQGLKTRLRETEDEILQMLREQEQQESDFFNESQQIRSKLLEAVRDKNSLEERIQCLQEDYEGKLKQLEDRVAVCERQIYQKNEMIEDMKLRHDTSTAQLQEKIIRTQYAKDSKVHSLEGKIDEYKSKITNLSQQLFALQKSNQQRVTEANLLKKQVQKYESTLNKSSQTYRRTETKNAQIQQMVGQLRQQLCKFNEVIEEKDQKIQEYRSTILTLRSKINELTSELNQKEKSLVDYRQEINSDYLSQQQMRRQIQQLQATEALLRSQLQDHQRFRNIAKNECESQTEHQTIFIQAEEKQATNKALDKMRLKYENAVEELRAYQAEYSRESQEREDLIFRMQNLQRQKEQAIEQLNGRLKEQQATISQHIQQVANLKETIDKNMYDGAQIEQVFDLKIEELRTFYEKKMEEECSRYKGVISLLKVEMSQLYREMDLKKAMEEEIFKEVMNMNLSMPKNQPEPQQF